MISELPAMIGSSPVGAITVGVAAVAGEVAASLCWVEAVGSDMQLIQTNDAVECGCGVAYPAVEFIANSRHAPALPDSEPNVVGRQPQHRHLHVRGFGEPSTFAIPGEW